MANPFYFTTKDIILEETQNEYNKEIYYNNLGIFTSTDELDSVNPVIKGSVIIHSNYKWTYPSDRSQSFNGELSFKITEIMGDLIIKDNPYIAKLIFPNLTKVHGSIIIDNISQLNEIDMPNIISIGNVLQITKNGGTPTTSSTAAPTVSALHLQIIDFKNLKTIGTGATISNNVCGKHIKSLVDGTKLSSTFCIPNFSSLENIGIPYSYSNFITIENNTLTDTDRNGITDNKGGTFTSTSFASNKITIIPQDKYPIGEGNRTFQLGMFFKSPNMTQGNQFSLMRKVFNTSTGNNNNKWFGTPAYKIPEREINKSTSSGKAIMTHQTGSSADYIALRKARAIGNNTTKFGTTNDLQISFSNSKSTNQNDIKSALSKMRNRGNVVPPKCRK